MHRMIVLAALLAACKPASEFEPSVEILSPAANATVDGIAIQVSLNVEDFLILGETAQSRPPQNRPMAMPPLPIFALIGVAEAHGDEEGQPKGYVALTIDVTTPVEVYDTQYVFSNVSSGTHTLTAELLYEDGDPLEPPVTDSVDFAVN